MTPSWAFTTLLCAAGFPPVFRSSAPSLTVSLPLSPRFSILLRHCTPELILDLRQLRVEGQRAAGLRVAGDQQRDAALARPPEEQQRLAAAPAQQVSGLEPDPERRARHLTYYDVAVPRPVH